MVRRAFIHTASTPRRSWWTGGAGRPASSWITGLPEGCRGAMISLPGGATTADDPAITSTGHGEVIGSNPGCSPSEVAPRLHQGCFLGRGSSGHFCVSTRAAGVCTHPTCTRIARLPANAPTPCRRGSPGRRAPPGPRRRPGVAHDEQIARIRHLRPAAGSSQRRMFALGDQSARIGPPRRFATARFGPSVLRRRPASRRPACRPRRLAMSGQALRLEAVADAADPSAGRRAQAGRPASPGPPDAGRRQVGGTRFSRSVSGSAAGVAHRK